MPRKKLNKRGDQRCTGVSASVSDRCWSPGLGINALCWDGGPATWGLNVLPTLAVQIARLSPGTHTTALKGKEFDWSHFIDKNTEIGTLQWRL